MEPVKSVLSPGVVPSSLISSSLCCKWHRFQKLKWVWMLFKSVLVGRVKLNGRLSWGDIWDLKHHIYTCILASSYMSRPLDFITTEETNWAIHPSSEYFPLSAACPWSTGVIEKMVFSRPPVFITSAFLFSPSASQCSWPPSSLSPTFPHQKCVPVATCAGISVD